MPDITIEALKQSVREAIKHLQIEALKQSVREAIKHLQNEPLPEYGGRRCVTKENVELGWVRCIVEYWYKDGEHQGILSKLDTNVVQAVDELEHAMKLLNDLEHNIAKG